MADAKEIPPAEESGGSTSKQIKEPVFKRPECLYVYCPNPDLCKVYCQTPLTGL